MNTIYPRAIAEATRLTREGRLQEATALLLDKRTGTPEPTRPSDRVVTAAYPALPSPTRDDDPHETATPAPTSTSGEPVNPDGVHMPQILRGVLGRIGQLPLVRGLKAKGGLHPVSPPTAMPEGARFEQRSFTNAAGSRDYKLYVPANRRDQPMPLVVMLHGCTQTPDDFASGTGMNALAEEFGVLVAYPAQDPSANPQRCWNWFNPADQQRNRGEASLIAGITREVMDDFAVDQARVYVAGLSAGGAAAAIMGTTYSDLYAAIGVHSGLASGAARDMPSAFAAMRNGGVPAAGNARTGARLVPTIVFHGDSDTTVSAVNGQHVITQSTVAAQLHATTRAGQSANGVNYTRSEHADAEGLVVAEHWVLHGAGHAWSGGNPAGSYTDPRGPDASREMLRFFLQHRMRG